MDALTIRRRENFLLSFFLSFFLSSFLSCFRILDFDKGPERVAHKWGCNTGFFDSSILTFSFFFFSRFEIS